MKNHFISCTLGILSFFLSLFFIIPLNGIDTLMINQKFNVERILPVVTATQIDKNMKLETIKAQTIIARSDYYRRLEERRVFRYIEGTATDLEKKVFRMDSRRKYERAVEETRERFLCEIINWSFCHIISSVREEQGTEKKFYIVTNINI